jgi:hypothetical protein
MPHIDAVIVQTATALVVRIAGVVGMVWFECYRADDLTGMLQHPKHAVGRSVIA